MDKCGDPPPPASLQRAGPANETEWYQGTVVLDHLILASTSVDAIRISGEGSVDIHDVHIGSTGQQAFAGARSLCGGATLTLPSLIPRPSYADLLPLLRRQSPRQRLRGRCSWRPCRRHRGHRVRRLRPAPAVLVHGGAPGLQYSGVQSGGSTDVAVRCWSGNRWPGGGGCSPGSRGRLPCLRGRLVRCVHVWRSCELVCMVPTC